MTNPIIPHISEGLQATLELAPKKYPFRRPKVRDHGQYRSAHHFHQSPMTAAEKTCLENRTRWDYAKSHEAEEALQRLACIQYELWHTALLAQSEATDTEQRKAA